MNNNIKNEVENKNGKGITFVSLGIMTLIAAISGATFAFFQATANAEFTGNSAYEAEPLGLTIVDETAASVGSGTSAKKLIPQIDEDIQTAITGSTNGSCVDSVGYAVCKVYSITISNLTTTNFYLNGSIRFTTTGTNAVATKIIDEDGTEKDSTTTMPNLKWAVGTSATEGFPSSTAGPFYTSFSTSITNTTATTQEVNLSDPFFLKKENDDGDSKTFYIVVWISETGSVQTDNGEFTGTVTFTGYSDDNKQVQGVTSSIRG